MSLGRHLVIPTALLLQVNNEEYKKNERTISKQPTNTQELIYRCDILNHYCIWLYVWQNINELGKTLSAPDRKKLSRIA
jgi:hypothetical protein